jgi:hypothetical protein
MKDLQIQGAVAQRLRVAAISVALVLGVAGPAAAGNVLFQYETQNCAQANVVDPLVSNVIDDCAAGNKVIGTVSGNTLMTTPTGSSPGFTIPTKIFSGMGSFSATAAPTFPYFKGTFTRFNKAGTLMANNWTPSAVKTFIDNDTAYPYASTQPTGFVRAKVGPNGMAGPAPIYERTYYEFTLVLGTQVFDAIAAITLNLGGPLSNNPVVGGFESNVNTVTTPTPSSNGNVVFLDPNIWAFTGTVTVDAPAPAAVTYFVKTAMDNRTPAGASGTIQVVSAMLAHQYTITSLPVPQDGSGVVSDLARQTGRAQLTTVEFLPVPEPGQIVLLGAGVFGLAGIWMRRRRSE